MPTPHEIIVVEADQIERRYSVIAFVSSWLIHTSYIVLPGTFTTLGSNLEQNSRGHQLAESVKNIPLLPFAMICSLSGSGGLIYLWHKWRHNYVWLTRNVFLPETASSFMGLISTLVNVYTAQRGYWSITAKVTAGVNSTLVVAMLIVLVFYNYQRTR